MWRGARTALPRGDTLMAMAIPTGCALLLVEAYFRTENGDADCALDAQFGPSDVCIQAATVHNVDLVDELERNGIIVIPNAISRCMLQSARDDIREYQYPTMNESTQPYRLSTTGFQPSSNESDVRQDTIAWIRETDPDIDSSDVSRRKQSEDASLGSGMDFCIRFLRGIPIALENQGYSATKSHRVPRQCQLALYSGDGEASYARHLDQCNASLVDLGLLEWMRLSDYRERRITLILYLNDPDRPQSHGGALRCWVAQDANDSTRAVGLPSVDDGNGQLFHPSFDIQPVGGTLVIFQSDRVDHQVLPSTVDRFALTNWVSSCAS